MMQDATSPNESESQILHPGSRTLFRHWEMCRAENACPTREDFTFGPIQNVMPDMVVIERDYLRNSFKFRLAGSRVCNLYVRNLTGANVLSGWDNFESDVISRHLMTVINQKQPAVLRMRLTTDHQQVVAVELLALPVLAGPNQRVQIIGGIFPFRESHTLGHSQIASQELVSGRVIWTEHGDGGNADLSGISGARQPQRPFRVIDGGKH